MASEMIGYCRICAQRNEDLVSVFDENGKYLQLYLKLKVCLQVTVMKNDKLPTTICLECRTQLEACYKLFQRRLRGEDTFQRGRIDPLHLPYKSYKTQGVMHGDSRPPPPVRMEEDMLDHPKRRKMRRHWNPEVTNPPPPPPGSEGGFHRGSGPEVCLCDDCTQSQYGALPLLVAAIESGGEREPPSFSALQACALPVAGPERPASAWAESPGPSRATAEEVPFVVGEAPPTADGAGSYASLHAPLPPPPPPERGASPGAEAGSSRTPPARRETRCDFCDKAFTHTGDLNKHRRTHTGERPYACRQCTRSFSHASNLRRHSKIHSGERPFACALCGKGFSRKDKMLGHEKSGACAKRPCSTPPPAAQ